jgi:hypothetical protein
MIKPDLENVDFGTLNDLEKKEYVAQLTLNLQKIVLQLMNSGDNQLASIISLSTSLAMTSPARLLDLQGYAAKLYEITQLESRIIQKAVQETTELKKDQEFPPLDTDKEQ